MSKTPEEMAEEYVWKHYGYSAINHQLDFLAGYKAAQEQYREAVKVLDKHKAAAEKAVTNIKNASDWVTIERLEGNSLDPIINLPTPAKWISVKDRLPEEGQDCLFYVDWIDVWEKGSERITYQEIGVFNGKDRFYHRAHTDLKDVTHWMPLPAPPKEEK